MDDYYDDRLRFDFDTAGYKDAAELWRSLPVQGRIAPSDGDGQIEFDDPEEEALVAAINANEEALAREIRAMVQAMESGRVEGGPQATATAPVKASAIDDDSEFAGL